MRDDILSGNAISTASNQTTILSLNDLRRMEEALKPMFKPDALMAHPAHGLQPHLSIAGISVYADEHLLDKVQTFKPRTKRKRIQRKAKKLYYKEVPSNTVYLLDTRKITKNTWQLGVNF